MRGRPARVALATLALATFVAAPAFAAVEPEGESQLEGLRSAIEDSRRRVETHERDERQLFDRLEEIGHNLDRLAVEVERARDGSERAKRALQDAEARRGVAAVRLEASRKALSKRAVALYKTGDVGAVRAIFAADSMRDFLARVSVLRALVDYDAGLVRRHGEDYVTLQRLEVEAEAALDRMQVATVQLTERRAELAAERKTRKVLLAKVRVDRVEERALLVELERASQALAETVAALGAAGGRRGESLEGAGFRKLRGSMRRPVQGRISQRFGKVVDEQFQTQTFRKGVEFDAPIGDEVVAVARGEVRFAGWFRGYGKIVILDHGDEYFTVSGHLSDLLVDVGDRVKRGDGIGRVGETGTLSGPSLYFEIRQGSEPKDPMGWFSSGN